MENESSPFLRRSRIFTAFSAISLGEREIPRQEGAAEVKNVNGVRPESAIADFAAEGKGQFFLLACHKRDGALLEKITGVKKFEF